MNVERTANLLGALALALVDEMERAAADTTGYGAAAPAALVGIGTTPGLTIDQLRLILQLSHSGTVRLVDRLAADGLVERRPARDGRAVSLVLTEQGTTTMDRLLEARQSLLRGAIERLPAAKQTALTTLLEHLLTGLVRSHEHSDHICRLCHEAVCEAAQCPVAQAGTGRSS